MQVIFQETHLNNHDHEKICNNFDTSFARVYFVREREF